MKCTEIKHEPACLCRDERKANWEILQHVLERSPFSLEILHRARVFFGLFARGERAQVLALAGLRVLLTRVEAVLA